MLICVKTTMNLPDALYAAVKKRAAAEDHTVTSLVEEALRARLSTPDGDRRVPVELPSWGAGSANGYLVDITNRDALWAALDDRS